MSIKTGTLPSQQSILKTGRLLLAFLLTIMSDQASASSHIYRFFTEAEDLAKQLNRQQAIILDVRDINAYAKGHIPQAVSLPIRGPPSQKP